MKVIYIILAFMLFGCTGADMPSELPDGAGTNIEIRNFAYSPQELTIKEGDTVTWINVDSVAHTVSGNLFESGNLDKGDSYSHTFGTAGTYDYICSYHPRMRGRIIVE